MILNLRGPMGSGKSWLAYRLMEELHAKPLMGEKGKVEAYHLDHNIYLVGRYETACGGMDTFSTRGKDFPEQLVRKYATLGHVIFEGLLLSTVWGRWFKVSQDFPREYVWIFLNTPLEVCCQRVLQRNGGKPFNTDNLKAKHDRNEKIYRKAIEAKEIAVWLDHKRPLEHFWEIVNPLLEDPSLLKRQETSSPEEEEGMPVAQAKPPSESTQDFRELSLF